MLIYLGNRCKKLRSFEEKHLVDVLKYANTWSSNKSLFNFQINLEPYKEVMVWDLLYLWKIFLRLSQM